MRNHLLWVTIMAVTLAGCGASAANCEVEVNGVTICVGNSASAKYCKQEWGGTPSPASSSSDPTCFDMGYEEQCPGQVVHSGDVEGDIEGSFEASHTYFAASLDDCDATDGGDLGK